MKITGKVKMLIRDDVKKWLTDRPHYIYQNIFNEYAKNMALLFGIEYTVIRKMIKEYIEASDHEVVVENSDGSF
jgi:hypothetical protein